MRIRDIAEKVRSGQITFEPLGHSIREPSRRFLESIEHGEAGERGDLDGKWQPRDGETTAEVDESMRQFYKTYLDMEFEQGDHVRSFGSGLEENCHACGQKLFWVLDGERLTLRGYYNADSKGLHDAFPNYPEGTACPLAVPTPTSGKINVTSRLLFANFFRAIEDQPKDEEWSDKWSLNNFQGRRNITQYKAERNVAYGQMDNTSVGIFVRPDLKSIIVGDTYDGDTDEDINEIDGHELKGNIILDVWRWEATDLNTIGPENYEEIAEQNQNRGMVEVEAVHGVWSFEHYYDTDTSPDKRIYARLSLVG